MELKPTTFSIMNIRSIDRNINIEEILKKELNEITPVRYVSLNEFKTYTSSKPIPRYILIAKQEARKEIEESATMLSENKEYDKLTNLNGKDKFIKIKTDNTDVYDNANLGDPAYAILDVHRIDSNSYIVTLNMNKNIPIFKHFLLADLAKRLSKVVTVDILAVNNYIDEHGNSVFFEHISKYESNEITLNKTVQYGNHLLTEYRDRVNVDVVDLLKKIDEDLDIYLAPQDMHTYEEIMKNLIKSKEFMEHITDDNDKLYMQDYSSLLEDIKQTKENMEEIRKKLMKEPTMNSIYFKFLKPEALSKYKKKVLFKSNVEYVNE